MARKAAATATYDPASFDPALEYDVILGQITLFFGIPLSANRVMRLSGGVAAMLAASITQSREANSPNPFTTPTDNPDALVGE